MNRSEFLKSLGLPLFTLMAHGTARAAFPPPLLPGVNVVYQDPSPVQKIWALAMSGMLAEMYRRNHAVIGHPPRTEADIKTGFDNLANGWRIRNQTDLQRRLDYFRTEGSSAEFNRIVRDIIGATPGKINQLKARYEGSPQVLHQMYLVEKFYPILGAKSLIAFDLARFVMLCRAAYEAEFMTENQVWNTIYPQAIVLQRTFSSWKEVGENYILGTAFVSANEYDKEQTRLDEALNRLLTIKQSPWVQLPWNLNLERPAVQR
jgi:hypothetical protein